MANSITPLPLPHRNSAIQTLKKKPFNIDSLINIERAFQERLTETDDGLDPL